MLGFDLAAGQDQAVEARFVDGRQLLRATKGVGSGDTLFVTIKAAHRVISSPNRERFADIGHHKSKLAVDALNRLASGLQLPRIRL